MSRRALAISALYDEKQSEQRSLWQLPFVLENEEAAKNLFSPLGFKFEGGGSYLDDIEFSFTCGTAWINIGNFDEYDENPRIGKLYGPGGYFMCFVHSEDDESGSKAVERIKECFDCIELDQSEIIKFEL